MGNLTSLGLGLCAITTLCAACATPEGGDDANPVPSGRAAVERAPNVILVVTDDQGFGDLSCAGHPTIHTPRLDALAATGRRLTQFYVASPVCSPSRAAFLTGCYPRRVSMHEHVVFPEYRRGLHPDEVTMAEALKPLGYRTACFGKWHLGHRPGMLPTDQGFDEWMGIPYSNDMSRMGRSENDPYPNTLPLMRGNEVIEWGPDQRRFTEQFTDEAVRFIEESGDEPFFLYLPHPMPHTPLYPGEASEGRSPRGRYGDVIEEIDDSVGRLVDALEASGVRDETLLIFTSDNGPWAQQRLNGGSAGPLRGSKGTNWEGGQRVPLILSWPGHVEPASVGTEVFTAMDLLPTIAALLGAPLGSGKELDGEVLKGALLGTNGAVQGRRAPFLYYTSQGAPAGIRRGPWKLLLAGPKLFHLEHDVSEKFNRAEREPALVEELKELAERLFADVEAGAREHFVTDEMLFDPIR